MGNGDSEPELNNIKQLIEIYNIDPDYLIYDECDKLNKNKIIPLNNKLKFLILLDLLLVITFIFLICLGFLPVWTHSSHLPTFFDSLIYYWEDPIFVIYKLFMLLFICLTILSIYITIKTYKKLKEFKDKKHSQI